MLSQTTIKNLKLGVWIYFYLLIFEGALRKWVLPGLSEPLLIIRDPVGLWLIYASLKYRVWKPNNYVMIVWLVTFLSFITALLVGHGSLIVAIYGFRITFIHFPLMFIMAQIFDKQDVIKMGKVMLWINIIMTLLVAAQLFSPQTAWVNRGVGGDTEGSGFQGTADFFRVPGTFSFTNGLSMFYGLAAAYIFYFWIDIKEVGKSKLLLIISTIALFAAIPLSISRTVLFSIILSLLFLIVISAKRPALVKQILTGAVGGIMIFTILSFFSFFQTAIGAFTDRFTSASESEGGLKGTLGDRFLGGLYGAIVNDNATFFGLGLGMGTNAGAKLLTGTAFFTIAELDWGRIIGEMGFVLGITIIIARISLAFGFAKKSWQVINTRGNLLPWMLVSFGLLLVLQGQWAQPTALGFSTLAGGLILASFNDTKK